MYCRQCGQVFGNDKAVICVKCGTNKGQGDNYCQECGEVVKNKEADVCLNCGVRLKSGINNIAGQFKNATKTTGSSTNNNNSKILACILALFLGGLGIHRFYLGYKEIGFIQLGIFVGGFLLFTPIAFISNIWALVDLVQIILGNLHNANGTELV